MNGLSYPRSWRKGCFACMVLALSLPCQSPSPPSVGGSDLNSSNSGCSRLGSGVATPLGVVEEEVAVLIVLVRRHRRAVGAAVRQAVDDEVPGAVEEEAGPAAVQRVPPSLLNLNFFQVDLRLVGK